MKKVVVVTLLQCTNRYVGQELDKHRQQEYSQRQAGLASGIIMAILIPLILLFVYLAYRFLQKKQKEKEAEKLEEQQFMDQQRRAHEAATKKLTEAEYASEDEDSNVTSTGAKETTVY